MRRVLDSGKLGELLEAGLRFHGMLARSLLDRHALEHKRVLVRYFDMVGEVKELAREVLVEAAGAGVDEAETYARLLAGELVYGRQCMPVVLRQPLGVKGGLGKPGAYTCMEPSRAVKLIAAGLAEPVETGLAFSQAR
ncbi:hypothetical protein CF15_02575 [Pyrodictium occultum]|uniref:Uncharacterized protein n=1 Tax=Pyrodictium occultum TaxID=2309 RepID=A0A0V8RUH2_PYROC|nr:hypothetical protein CF15_02575 [Pyrodictium occultum]